MSKKWYEYDFATIRLVPRVHRDECRNLGVIVFSPSEAFLSGRFVDGLDSVDPATVDRQLLERYLRGFSAILMGRPAGGPIAELSASERFHWLTAPRSDILQPGPVHHGRCHNLESCVDELFEALVDG